MLPIQISGHGVEITPALQDFIHKKFNHLLKYSDQIISIHIFLEVVKMAQKAEANVHIPGFEASAHAESEDMYKTIDLIIAKLSRQLEKHKEKTSKKR